MDFLKSFQKMDYSALNNPNYSKQLAINNLATCIYLPLLIFCLNLSGHLYDMDYHKTFILHILAAAEVIKYAVCWRYRGKSTKKNDLKRIKIQNFFKGLFTLICTIFLIHIVAILLGAPFFLKKSDTLTFSVIMTSLTALPCCLHLGADSVPILILSLTRPEENRLLDKFLLLMRLTFFGAWLGAVVIPLDWNKPYQVWPIPCILGGLTGFFCGNFYQAFCFWSESKYNSTKSLV